MGNFFFSKKRSPPRFGSNTEFKVVVLGGGGVGKSALTIRLVTNNFLDEYDPTIEDSYRKSVVIDDEPALLDLLDTAGQEEFSSMQDQWMREGQVFLVVYSITSRSTFDEAIIMREKILRCKEEEEPPIILVGNKCDLEDQRQVLKSEGQQLAQEWGEFASFFETSAKSKINHEECFYAACRFKREQIRRAKVAYQEMMERMQAEEEKKKEEMRERRKSMPLICCKIFAYLCLCGWLIHIIYICVIGVCQCNILCYDYCKCCKCCTSACKKIEKDSSEIEDLEKIMKKNQMKLAFLKVKKVEEDIVREPILSLKNFKIKRQFSWIRFIKTLLCGLFLPLVVTFQTIIFLIYSDKQNFWCYKYIYPESYPYDEIRYSLLLDFLGLVIGRYPNQDPDAAKGRAWFLRQTLLQKLQRVIIAILLCATFLIIYYNISQVKNEKLRVSMMELQGPFVLFWILWLLLSCWIAFESKLEPPMPSTFRLRSIKLYLGERFSHITDAYKFIRAYAWSRNTKWQLPLFHTVIILLLGLMYALIPGITRLTVGDSSNGLKKKKFITWKEFEVEVGALFVNFILISSFIYAIEVQYTKHFDNYKEWMYDLTMLLNKTTTNNDGNNDEHYIPQKGQNFSKDIFLSLTRRSNALGWLEIRSFLAAEGKLLFAEQELPTLWILLLTISMSIFILYRVFFIDTNPFRSILFNGVTILSIICLTSLIRIAITGYQFESIQRIQERLLGEQRFFMRCNQQFNVLGTGNNDKMDDHKKDGDGKDIRLKITKQAVPITSNVELVQYIQKELVLAKTKKEEDDTKTITKSNGEIKNEEDKEEEEEEEDDKEKDKEKDTENAENAEIKNEEEEEEKEETKLLLNKTDEKEIENMEIKEEEEEEEKEEAKTVLNTEIMTENDKDEDENDEFKPLLRKSKSRTNDNDIMIDMKREFNKIHDYMTDKSGQSDKFGFIDNMLFIVERKDIFPRLFKVKLNSVLAKAIAGVLVSAIAATAKLLF